MVPPKKTRSASRHPAGFDSKTPTASGTGKDKADKDTKKSLPRRSGQQLTVPILIRSTRQQRIVVSDSSQDYQSDIPEIVRSRIPVDISQNGLDPTLPPIHSLKDIFDDITRRAMELGFAEFLSHLGSRKLRVVTMCSGTESPLLALEMVGKSLYLLFP